MAEHTKIGWTDHTFNPWQGCEHVSPACDHCYAETLSKRTGHPDRWGGPETVRDRTSVAYWRNPAKWNAAAEARGRPALVFCGSLCDVFEDRPELDEIRADLWALIAETPHLRWLLLTKRPQNIARMVPSSWHGNGYADDPRRLWPVNVWVGSTVEDQARADERIPHLLAVPAPVRFLSMEPLFGWVDLVPWTWRREVAETIGLGPMGPKEVRYGSEIGWVITGGESGPGHRPLDLDAVRELRRISELCGIPFFFKQHGGQFPGSGGHLLDGELHYEWPVAAGDRSAERAAALEAETTVEIRT